MTTTNPPPSDHLAKRVLDRIVDEHLTPRPRWEFLFKNYFFWSLGALAVALGALAFSATLFEITNVDWRFSTVTHPDFLTFFLAVAPFFWVIALALFLLIGYANIRSTKHGYRYSLATLALGAVLTSLALGSMLYATGLGGAVDAAIGDHPPFYRPIIAAQHSWWLAPERGLLGGQVIQADPSGASFTLRDFNGHIWQVSGSDLRTPDLTAVARGGTVRVVGVPTTATSTAFHACFIFTWRTNGKFPGSQLAPSFTLHVASTSERGEADARSEICRDIRPYQQLRSIDENGL
ncbi:MAG TPA: hypothetical protein PLW99_00090 [Candidatus Paceibacterota bacterium]|nr:MAG: hypothetical protein B7X03_03415 [Parcubacteria group bacterium 21-58-10]HQT82545.1 hypothetical protein [Candidatus Paceibacterota bacterium]